MNNLRRLDLNLLVTLDVLLAEHNVTRAAEKLNMSQPSVSVQLQKLRDVFGDPLLLPGPRGMRPTARAEALREPLRDALEAVERAVIPATPFDPATATNTWRVAATDYGESTIVLPALNTLRSAAPATRLAVVELVPPRIEQDTERNGIDLVFHMTEASPPGMRRLPLFAERYVLIGRAGHPKLKRRPTLAQFGTLEHVIVSPDGGGFFGVTDEALAKVAPRGASCCRCRISCSCCRPWRAPISSRWCPSGWCATCPRCAWWQRPSTCPAMKCRCCGTNACIAIRRIGGCGRRSRQRCRSVACPGGRPLRSPSHEILHSGLETAPNTVYIYSAFAPFDPNSVIQTNGLCEATMFQASAFDPEQPGFNPVHFERAAQRAVVDLQRVAGGRAAARRRTHPAAVRTMSWQALLNVEELAFSNAGFLSRNDPAVVDAFIRLRDSRLVAADVEEPVDWRRDDDDLPAIYLIVKAMLEAEEEERAEAA